MASAWSVIARRRSEVITALRAEREDLRELLGEIVEAVGNPLDGFELPDELLCRIKKAAHVS